ncbi:MAG: prephenate dehydrogenase/arogenate dehydrogenase family protein [Bryobacteraceae bacterium]
MRESGIRVTISDSRPFVGTRSSRESQYTYVESDVRVPSAELISEIRASDCVCLCLPETVTLDAVASVLPLMSKGSLWVDTLSVKTEIAQLLAQHIGHCELLSLNPMFAPSLGWARNAVAAVEIDSGPKTSALHQLISSWGAQVVSISAVEHDKLTAAVQVATHAAVLAFGQAVVHLDVDISKTVKLATPPHRLLLALLYRIASQNPDVYWDIQTWHPLGGVVRNKLSDGVARIDDASGADGLQRFHELFEQIRDVLEPESDILRAWTEKLIAALTT